MNKVPLSHCGDYAEDRVEVSSLTVNNYISTDNMLPYKRGITEAENLPNTVTTPAFLKNDILLSNIRPYFRKIWYANFQGGCSADVLVFRTNEKYDPKYIYYALSQSHFFDYMMAGSKGSKMPRGDKDHVKEYLISDFDIDIQKKIGSYLSLIDEKIEINKKIISQTEELAKVIYDYWFVQFEFPNNEGKPYKSSGGEMVWNEALQIEIPIDWDDEQLSDMANITMGQSPDGSSYNEDGEGVVFYQGRTDFGYRFPMVRMYTSEPARMANKGDVLLSVRAPVGDINIANENCCIGRGLAALNSKEGYNSYLFYLMLKLKPVFDVFNGAGTTFGAITKDFLFEIKILKPQKTTIEKFEGIIKNYDEIIFTKEQELRNLEEVRDWLLPMLMNGQVTFK